MPGGTWGSMLQQLKDDVHGLVSDDTIRRKIVDSVRFHRDKGLWYSERTFRFNLTADKSTYGPGDGFGLPEEVVEIVGKNIRVLLNGSESNVQQCERATSAEFDLALSSDDSSGDPEIWDFHAGELRIWPAPSTSDHILTGRYVRDIGVPRVDYESSAYVFRIPDGSTTIASDFTNDWFDQQGGEAMIRARAQYLLCKYLKDDAGAEDALTLWLEYKGQLEDESEARTSAGLSLRPTLLG